MVTVCSPCTRLIRVDAEAFHQDALGLPDHVAGGHGLPETLGAAGARRARR